MQYKSKLIPARFIKRYKRFFADMELDNGEVVTAHCPNTGTMKTCYHEGCRVMVSHHDDPNRKLKYSWELSSNSTDPKNKDWICVNTSLPNYLVYEAIEKGVITELPKYSELKMEVKYGTNSRIDVLLTDTKGIKHYIEVKNTTLLDDKSKRALFPDAVSERGKKHLEELEKMVADGHKAYMFYLVNRSDATGAGIAKDIDPEYYKACAKAIKNGVQILAYQTHITPDEIVIQKALPFEL